MKLPYKLGELAVYQRREIRSILGKTSKDVAQLATYVQREKDIQDIRSHLRGTIDSSINEVGQVIFTVSTQGRNIAIESDIDRFAKTKLPRIDYDAFNEYTNKGRSLVGERIDTFMKRKSYIDGRTLGYRLKTIKDGASDIVEAIIRNGLRDGKSSWEVARELEVYLLRDKRTRWTSPYHIMRREKGFPISVPYTGDVPAGSVDYNAMRIARTELINNYRWARLEATANKDWVLGWQWALSPSHPHKDICDDWAAHDEGLGKGVYSNPKEVATLGHPQCLCDIHTVTIFDAHVSQYFDRAEKKGFINPVKYGY